MFFIREGGDKFGYRDTKWRLNMALLVQNFFENKALVAGPLKKDWHILCGFPKLKASAYIDSSISAKNKKIFSENFSSS